MERVVRSSVAAVTQAVEDGRDCVQTWPCPCEQITVFGLI